MTGIRIIIMQLYAIVDEYTENSRYNIHVLIVIIIISYFKSSSDSLHRHFYPLDVTGMNCLFRYTNYTILFLFSVIYIHLYQ